MFKKGDRVRITAEVPWWSFPYGRVGVVVSETEDNADGCAVRCGNDTGCDVYCVPSRDLERISDKDNYMMINGKKIEISDETASNLEKQFAKKDTGWITKHTSEKRNTFRITEFGVGANYPYYPNTDANGSRILERAAGFLTQTKAEEIDFKQTLWRKMQRWADEHNGEFGQTSYFISYEVQTDYWHISPTKEYYDPMCVYFSSRKLAEQALEIFRDDLEKARTWGQ